MAEDVQCDMNPQIVWPNENYIILYNLPYRQGQVYKQGNIWLLIIIVTIYHQTKRLTNSWGQR